MEVGIRHFIEGTPTLGAAAAHRLHRWRGVHMLLRAASVALPQVAHVPIWRLDLLWLKLALRALAASGVRY